MLMRRQDRVADYALLPRATESRGLDSSDGSYRRYEKRKELLRCPILGFVLFPPCSWSG